ncbi:MAG: acetyl-CoA carboxylase biotin carboxyl carrier protein subunit [Bacteroidales bacterium]|nr:acetyl-CoA carboxylase biotin carboxyl carrier protein subunit [Bacteroidales bacterium]
MAEKENITPQKEELQTLAPTNDSTEFLVPDSGKKKLRVAEEGHEYKTYLTKKFLERKMWKAPDPLQVLSHIPGSVIEIFVKPGQKVKKGDKLMIYEAMKMMNVVSAPMDGVIKEVNAKEGENLPKGALLVTFKKPVKK